MSLTIKEIDERIDAIEVYYNQFGICSYEYPSEDKRYLIRLYNLKSKHMNKILFKFIHYRYFLFDHLSI